MFYPVICRRYIYGTPPAGARAGTGGGLRRSQAADAHVAGSEVVDLVVGGSSISQHSHDSGLLDRIEYTIVAPSVYLARRL